MQLISDIFLAAGAFGAALYCYVLQRRLKRFTGLEGSIGSAIAILSAQVDDLTRALSGARHAAEGPGEELAALMQRAENAGERLELLISSLHDLPDGQSAPPPRQTELPRPKRYRIRPAIGAG